jgi:hypothetical protein
MTSVACMPAFSARVRGTTSKASANLRIAYLRGVRTPQTNTEQTKKARSRSIGLQGVLNVLVKPGSRLGKLRQPTRQLNLHCTGAGQETAVLHEVLVRVHTIIYRGNDR